MSLTSEYERILSATVDVWFRNFAGTSALDVAENLSLDHSQVMRAFEELTLLGCGSLNRNVGLIQVSFDTSHSRAGYTSEPITTHIFFPSKECLRKAFFASDLPQQRLPEYTTRLHLGAHQLGLVYFVEEVLVKYFNHPEHYQINDSLAGGHVSTLSAAPKDRYLWVRYGKSRLKSGQIVVAAIYKDLSYMSSSEQRYWHSHEIELPDIDESDVHFQKFLRRTYEGDPVCFDDPIARVLKAVLNVNAALGDTPLFQKVKNIHLRLPVEHTYKSYCDAASELYKIVGPDNISQVRLKDLLCGRFGLADADLKHLESGRSLSTWQLLALVEERLGSPSLLTKPLSAVKGLRIDADHRMLEPDTEPKSYSRQFAGICNDLAASLERLAAALAEHDGA